MKFYKFMDEKHVDSFVRHGIIRMSKLSYYRRLEIESGSRWIGDKDEGVMRFTHDPVFVDADNFDASKQTPRQLHVIDAMFGDISQIEGSISASGNRLHTKSPDYHIWCFSQGSLSELFEAMNNSGMPKKYRYNTAIEISNPIEFCLAIDNGYIDPPVDLSFQSKFKGIVLDKIEYSGHDRHLTDAGLSASPFVKSPFFEHQREYRIATASADNGLPENIFVKMKNFRHLISGIHNIK